MDGVSAAASIIAIIEISAKVAALCVQYSVAVKNAGSDVQRLQGKVEDIGTILGNLKQKLEGPDRVRLSVTGKLTESLKGCQQTLQELEEKLQPSKTRTAMSRVGARALKWPFKSKELEKVRTTIERYQQTFSLSLQIDQTYSLTLDSS